MFAGVLLITPLLLAPPHLPANVGPGASLSAAAAAAGRPPECGSRSRRALAKGPSVWELARVPNLQRYCDLVARAQTELASSPKDARRSAEDADKALPGHAAPAVVIARASLALGQLDEAAKAFARARAADARSVEDPKAMHDLARVLAGTGKRDEALSVYRALVPRVDLLGSTDRRVLVMLEAAHLSMTAEGAGGPPSPGELAKPRVTPRRHLDEAAAYLREAQQLPPSALSGEVMLSLALVLDRSGAREEADAMLAEAVRGGVKVRAGSPGSPGSLGYVAAPEDRAALEALSAEGSDRAAAIKGWEAYLGGAGGKGPWAAAAKARLDVLKKGGGGRAAPKGKAR